MKSKHYLPSAFAFVFVVVFGSAAPALAEKKPPSPKDFQRPYRHVCAAGTEQYGEEPPKGSRMFCRMPIGRNEYILQGAYTQWYGAGHRKVEGVYDRNVKEGKWTTYYPNGRKRTEIEYVGGKETKKTLFDGNGKPVDRSKQEERLKKIKETREKEKEANAWLAKTRHIKFNERTGKR